MSLWVRILLPPCLDQEERTRIRNFHELWSHLLSRALSSAWQGLYQHFQPPPHCPARRWCVPTEATHRICTQVPVHTAVLRLAEWPGRDKLQLPPQWSLPNRQARGDAQESGANACLGGGLLCALYRLALMILTSCVYVQEKNQRRCLPAPISLARSLLLPLSFALSLPLQTLDLNLLRIPHRGRQQP